MQSNSSRLGQLTRSVERAQCPELSGIAKNECISFKIGVCMCVGVGMRTLRPRKIFEYTVLS